MKRRKATEDEDPSILSAPAATDNVRAVDPFQQILVQGRCALLLRPQIVETLEDSQIEQARRAFGTMSSLVPAGDVLLQAWQCGQLESINESLTIARRFHVGSLYLDRHVVTNEQYWFFLEAGGYLQESLWNQAAWQRVNEFVDQDGKPGPMGWKSGSFDAGAAQHPVVGISWFEADAYAHWAGKRLPTDAEWVKAASWPVEADDGELVQRRFPWGDTPDAQKANLWGSHRRGTAPVTAFPDGSSIGGVHQLIGNVWEWTSTSLQVANASGRVRLEGLFKILRGGAFDTYFDNQATCQFQSADAPFARRHNIGFRCATGMCDVAGAAEADRLEDAGSLCAGTVGEEITA